MVGTTVKIGNYRTGMTQLPNNIMTHPLLSPKAMQARAVAKLGIGDIRLSADQKAGLVAGDIAMLSQPEIFPGLKNAKYFGPQSNNMVGYRYFCPDIRVPSIDMRMGEVLNFAMPAWHFNTTGTDMFSGFATVKHPWDNMRDPLAQSLVRLRALIEFCAKMGIPNHCWHDGDYVDLTQPIKDAEAQFALVGDSMKELQDQSGVKTGWGTNQFFAIPLYRKGAGTSPYMPAFIRAARQAKQSINTAIKLGAKRFVFWGGREGIYHLLSTLTDQEKKTLAAFLWMCVKHADAQGFFANGGKFLIEPKGKEPTAHQYDKDVETCIAFLKENGLEKYFGFNVEVNHAYLAGNSAKHEFRMAIDREMLGGIDANQGNVFLGWDLDLYAADLQSGLDIGEAAYNNKGLQGGVINHDAKLQGFYMPEYPMSMALAVWAAQDSCTIGVWQAHFNALDGRVARMVADRYQTWEGDVAANILAGNATLDSLSPLALDMEAEGLFDSVPTDPYETMERIMADQTIGLKQKITAEIRRQGF